MPSHPIIVYLSRDADSGLEGAGLGARGRQLFGQCVCFAFTPGDLVGGARALGRERRAQCCLRRAQLRSAQGERRAAASGWAKEGCGP